MPDPRPQSLSPLATHRAQEKMRRKEEGSVKNNDITQMKCTVRRAQLEGSAPPLLAYPLAGSRTGPSPTDELSFFELMGSDVEGPGEP